MESFVNDPNTGLAPNEFDYNKAEGTYPATYHASVEINPYTTTDFTSNVNIGTNIVEANTYEASSTPVETYQNDYTGDINTYQTGESATYGEATNTFDIADNVNVDFGNTDFSASQVVQNTASYESNVAEYPVTKPGFNASNLIDTNNFIDTNADIIDSNNFIDTNTNLDIIDTNNFIDTNTNLEAFDTNNIIENNDYVENANIIDTNNIIEDNNFIDTNNIIDTNTNQIDINNLIESNNYVEENNNNYIENNEIVSTPQYEESYQQNECQDVNNLVSTPEEYPITTTPVEYQAETSPIEYQAETAPIEYQAEATPIEYQAESAPVEYQAETKPVEYTPEEYTATTTPVEYQSASAPVEYPTYNYDFNKSYDDIHAEYDTSALEGVNNLSFDQNNLLPDIRNSIEINTTDVTPYKTLSYNQAQVNYAQPTVNNVQTTTTITPTEYKSTSVPVNVPPVPKNPNEEIIAIDEVVYVPVKKRKYIKRIKVPVKKTVIVPKKVVVPLKVKKTVVVPKKKVVLLKRKTVQVVKPPEIKYEPIPAPIPAPIIHSSQIIGQLRGPRYRPRVYRKKI